jgi:hypothetical protein
VRSVRRYWIGPGGYKLLSLLSVDSQKMKCEPFIENT